MIALIYKLQTVQPSYKKLTTHYIIYITREREKKKLIIIAGNISYRLATSTFTIVQLEELKKKIL